MIDPLSAARQPTSFVDQEAVPLAQQVAKTPRPSSADNADTEALYQALINASAGFDAYEYLKQFINAAGEHPYATSGPQLTALQQVMARMKEEGGVDDPAYALAKDAFSKAFCMNFMVREFMSTAMSASDDEDSRENVQW